MARLAAASDLAALLEFYRHLNLKMLPLTNERAQDIWATILSREGASVFVADAGAMLVATCLLITAPPPMRGCRLRAFIENVVTHPRFRRQG